MWTFTRSVNGKPSHKDVSYKVKNESTDPLMFAEGRKKQDIENRLQVNAAEQKQMNESALHARLELQMRQSEQKVQVSALNYRWDSLNRKYRLS